MSGELQKYLFWNKLLNNLAKRLRGKRFKEQRPLSTSEHYLLEIICAFTCSLSSFGTGHRKPSSHWSTQKVKMHLKDGMIVDAGAVEVDGAFLHLQSANFGKKQEHTRTCLSRGGYWVTQTTNCSLRRVSNNSKLCCVVHFANISWSFCPWQLYLSCTWSSVLLSQQLLQTSWTTRDTKCNYIVQFVYTRQGPVFVQTKTKAVWYRTCSKQSVKSVKTLSASRLSQKNKASKRTIQVHKNRLAPDTLSASSSVSLSWMMVWHSTLPAGSKSTARAWELPDLKQRSNTFIPHGWFWTSEKNHV